MKKFYLLALIAAILFGGQAARADGDFYVIAGGGGVGTKITSLPYEINKPGFYYLGGNLTSTGAGIIVKVENVTIDLMGFTMSGPGKSLSWDYAVNPAANTEVRNGTITGFYQGIYCNALEKKGVRAINLKVTKCQGGILVYEGLVQNCFISENQGDLSGISNYKGIVTGNTVNNNRTGLNVSRCTVTNNTITSNMHDGVRTEYSIFNNNVIMDNNTDGGFQNVYEYSPTNTFGTNVRHIP